MHADLSLRTASDADAHAIGQFINVCTTTYQGIPRSSEHDALERLHQNGSDPARDSFLVYLREDLVGFGHVWRFTATEVKCFARTHPEATGRGVGSLLLERCERRAAELLDGDDRGRLTTTSWAADTHAGPLLEGRGYDPIRHFLKMTIEAASVPAAAPPWPPTVRPRPFVDGADDEPLYEAFRAAFAEHWGSLSETREQWWHERRDRRPAGEFDPSLWMLAVDEADRVVGFSLCEETRSGIGRVAELGVVPSSRARGLGYALLVHSFQLLKERGAGEITLDVDTDNLTSALRLYLKAGMTSHPSFTVWERAVTRSASAP